MTMPNGSPLAPYSHSWVGGDIEGLSELAANLRAYVPHVQDLTGRLTVVAQNLTCDGPDGWQGKAADAFMASWGRQSRAAVVLEDYVTAVATTISSLAVELSHIENALELQAEDASTHGVRVGGDGTVIAYAGERAYPYARAYEQVRQEALSSADAARTAAAQQLNDLLQKVISLNPHPNAGDDATLADVFANLMAVPTAARRDVTAKIKKLTGQDLKLNYEIAEAERAGSHAPREVFDESGKVDKELQEVQSELRTTGRLENSLSKLLDTRAGDVSARLQGAAGPGRHVRGNTPEDLRAAASEEPSAVKNALGFAESIPVVDVAATVAGTAIGTYYDVQDGQSMPSAIGDELLSNSAGTIATNASATAAGTLIGTRLGAAGGPVGLAVGAVVGYGVGEMTHYMLPDWSKDVHDHGLIGGTADDLGHAAVQTGDDARGLVTGIGDKVENAWDDITGG